ncbi:MAG: hypothetical protein GC203_13880 [Phenylobacterium sp.]|uniref:asparagine synthase-related protein n=1 Tax=Phenylobacterium sp. TaxID=1871053 RepID=UPI0025E240EC|nr:asparagine synthase-related protein [Phenylobacterium sp.]MBI1198946.1 hypothetical protein [Phenylobacterium sp.]
MTQYVALSWAEDASPPPQAIGWLRRTLAEEPGWRIVLDEPTLLVAVSARHPLAVRHLKPSGVIIGDLFARNGGDAGSWAEDAGLRGGGHDAVCRTLADRYWGRYVAIQRGGPATSIFRDPMGALECVTWRASGVEVVASTLPGWLTAGLPPRLALNWSVVASHLAHPTNVSGPLALDGVHAVTPGVMRTSREEGAAEVTVWSPAGIVRTREPDLEPGRLVEVLDTCVRALVRDRTVLAEVSGGLDSAIVATALARAPDVRVAQWLNYHLGDAEGDERPFARAVARRAGVTLTEAVKPGFAIDDRALSEVAHGPRPAVWATDGAYDRDVARRCVDVGAEALLTGKGGDTVFFQMATALVAADHLRARGVPGLFDPVIPDVARWTRRSVWAVLRASLLASAPFAGASRGTAATARHPWLRDIADLPPGKRLHIRSLASCLTFSGDCRRAQAAHLIHPILAQPVVEHCLALSTVVLTQGRRDRAFARRAFADRLPPEVSSRWGKGDATAFFGRALAEHRDFLRAHLLDGRLVAAGLLNRRRLEQALQEDSLIWRGGFGSIIHAVAVESWVRAWERRLWRLG